jgi:hypothetical protein
VPAATGHPGYYHVQGTCIKYRQPLKKERKINKQKCYNNVITSREQISITLFRVIAMFSGTGSILQNILNMSLNSCNITKSLLNYHNY